MEKLVALHKLMSVTSILDNAGPLMKAAYYEQSTHWESVGSMSQPVQRRRRLSKEIRQAELLDAAAQIFREKGYHDALTAEIAERAGVVEGTIYRYFATKRDLLNMVVERAYEETIADFATQLHGITGTWNQLRYLIWRHLKTIHDDPALSRLVQYEIKGDPDYRSSRVFQLNRAYTRRTVEIIEHAIRDGEFQSDVPISIIRDMIYGCVEHHTWSYVRGEGPLDAEKVADHITNMVYRGLTPQRQADPAPVADALARIEERLDKINAHFNTTEQAK